MLIPQNVEIQQVNPEKMNLGKMTISAFLWVAEILFDRRRVGRAILRLSCLEYIYQSIGSLLLAVRPSLSPEFFPLENQGK